MKELFSRPRSQKERWGVRRAHHRLKACIPDGATVTRHGGDEFAFVLPKGSSLTADVSKAIEALRADGTLEQLVQTWLADQGAPFLS